ncbi:MAG: hypothetical protein ACREA4_04415 [Nitrososphaera sp.]
MARFAAAFVALVILDSSSLVVTYSNYAKAQESTSSIFIESGEYHLRAMVVDDLDNIGTIGSFESVTIVII